MPSKSTLVALVVIAVAYFFFPAMSTGIIIGLLIGWNLLEQPAIVRTYWDKAVAKIKSFRS